jgi:hypothetical protein
VARALRPGGSARGRRSLPGLRALARRGRRAGGRVTAARRVPGEYENEGWPARYLFDGGARLFEYHFGEGGYEETERAIQELLGTEREPVLPVRPEDVPGAALAPPTPEQPGAYSGPYEAGGVWAVLEGDGEVSANGKRLAVDSAGAYPLIEHERHTAGELALELGGGVVCHATCFTPGLA